MLSLVPVRLQRKNAVPQSVLRQLTFCTLHCAVIATTNIYCRVQRHAVDNNNNRKEEKGTECSALRFSKEKRRPVCCNFLQQMMSVLFPIPSHVFALNNYGFLLAANTCHDCGVNSGNKTLCTFRCCTNARARSLFHANPATHTSVLRISE